MSEENKDCTTQLEEIQELIKSHSDRLRYHQCFGTPAEKVKGLLRLYEDKAISAIDSARRFRDDMHVYFRALIIVLDMTGNAATHAEKNARLRGAVELLERMSEQLRTRDLDIMFSHYRWRDAFASDLPTRSLMDRIHELEAENAALKQPPPIVELSAEEIPI